MIIKGLFITLLCVANERQEENKLLSEEAGLASTCSAGPSRAELSYSSKGGRRAN